MRSPAATVAFVLAFAPACSSTSRLKTDQGDSAGGAGATEAGTGGSGANGNDGSLGAGGAAGSGVDCPGAPPCTRTVYRIPNPVTGITRMDPYGVLDLAVGPDRALTEQTADSDDELTTGAETYIYFALSCPSGRQYAVTWEGRADVNSTREVLFATADGTYVPGDAWPTVLVSDVPTDSDITRTVRGLVPDSLGNVFVRINAFGGKQFTDWLAVGSCI